MFIFDGKLDIPKRNFLFIGKNYIISSVFHVKKIANWEISFMLYNVTRVTY